MEHKTEKNMLMLKGEGSPCLQPRHSGYGLCDVVTRSLSREFPWLVRLLTTFASAIYNYAYSRVFQHPLERALRRRARNALGYNAHGSRDELVSLTWIRPSASNVRSTTHLLPP